MRVGSKLIATHEMDWNSGAGNDFTTPVGAVFTIDSIENHSVYLKSADERVQYSVLQVPVFNIKRGFVLLASVGDLLKICRSQICLAAKFRCFCGYISSLFVNP